MASAHPAPNSDTPAELQAEIETLGNRLFDSIGTARTPLFSASGIYARLMDWAMKDEAFKTQLFRFVDTLPALGDNRALVRHLQEYLGDAAVELSPLLKGGLAVSGLAAPVVGPAVRANITSLARQFIAGEDAAALAKTLRALHADGVAATVDLLGEAVLTDAEADRYLARNLEILDALAATASSLGAPCAGDLAPDGPLPRVNLSVKISALDARINTAAPEESIDRLKERLRPILRRAATHGALVNFDMESYALKDFTLRLFKSLLEEPEFAAAPAMGLALQAYLRDCATDADEVIAWARRRARPLVIRLVKGAYWDYETIHARQNGWPVPVWSHKAESDLGFERITEKLLEHADIVRPAFGTHNIRSIAHAVVQARRRGLDPRAIEFQVLYGMAGPIKQALLREGLRVRAYCPCGDLLPGMAYFVRRLLENTSNEGFLRRSFVEGEARSHLLADPARFTPAAAAPARADAPFTNEPGLDLSRSTERDRFASALAAVRRTLGRDHPPVVDGVPVRCTLWDESVNPAHPSQRIGRAGRATIADTDRALAAARAALPDWSRRPAPARASVLEKLATLLRAARHELAALEVLEVGKPWAEADADVTEAIDFCLFYAREMRRLGVPQPNTRVPGESSYTHHLPRGVAAVIAPWNFPLAILCGMTTAALVAGNTVVMKPAEQSPVVAARLFSLLLEAGVPPGAVHFLPGLGEEIGAHLVAHPQVDLVAFTGSRAVGLKIWEAAGRTPRGQAGLKKVVCEMGGKNALIIDADADLDEAVPAALHSAFGFAGQKCSALSRLIVVQDNYDRCLERLAGCAATLVVDDPALPRTRIGPVINAEAHSRILATIEEASRSARTVWRGNVPGDEGWYVPPIIFADVPPDSRLAREEVFGPVLAVFRVRDITAAIALANDSEFALTAGIFSRSPASIELARAGLVAGNVYINRGITGALVGRHPFGGYRMSGGGTKAGGPGYLEHFLVPRSVTENMMRRGFAPPDEGA